MKNIKFLLSMFVIIGLAGTGISILSSSNSEEQSHSSSITELSRELSEVKKELNILKESTNNATVSIDPFIGEVTLFAGNFAPRGWAFCEGQLLPIAQYQALYSLLGTTYGGDGRTSFALPDLRGRTPISPGQGPGLDDIRLGNRGGMIEQTLTRMNLPSSLNTLSLPVLEFDPRKPRSEYLTGNKALISVDNPSTGVFTTTTNFAGINQSFSIRSPYLGMHYIIALQGVFPSRN